MRLIRLLKLVFWFVVVGSLIRAIGLLATNPNVERPVLGFFVPPVIAILFLAADNGKFNRTVIRGCELFLGMIAVAVILGEQQFVIPNLKPQFPGMPAQAERILIFYFVAYGLFLWIICPAFVLGTPIYLRSQGLPQGMSSVILYAGLICWLSTIAGLAVIIATSDKFF
jgi:hypothetical protein